jgi:hypothetical protein
MVTQKEVEESRSDHPLAQGLPDTPLASTLEESDQRVDALEDDE